MFGQHDQLIAAGELGVGGDGTAAVEDPDLAIATFHLDRMANERERHRVAVGVEADEKVLGDDAGEAGLEPEPRPSHARQQVRPFFVEAFER